MSEYLLVEPFFEGVNLEIEENDYHRYVCAKKYLRILWDIEEAFNLFANSFVEFEEFLLQSCIKYHYERSAEKGGYLFFDSVREKINLKLVSMLTASRLYEDQLKRRLSELKAQSQDIEMDIESTFNKVFDESLEYRVMYALRNHALHHRLPLGGVTFSGSNLSETGDLRDDAPTRLRVTIDPYLLAADIVSSDKIKKSTRGEVEQLGCKGLDLKFFMRGFVAKLTECHLVAREMTAEIASANIQILQEAFEKLLKKKGSTPKHLSVWIREEGRKIEDHYIDPERYNQVIKSRRLWSGLEFVQRGYVSSEIIKKKDVYPSDHPSLWIPK